VNIGLIVIVVLAVLTGAEYAVAVEMDNNLIPLVLMGLVKAALIIWYFMHIKRIAVAEEEHE
jgi:heme/copper-type cytochrome/quinol oxidase subunit 4